MHGATNHPDMRVIIDTDPGIDDSVALALAVHSPELDIAAITTTYGNTTVVRATRNARQLLARLDVKDASPFTPGRTARCCARWRWPPIRMANDGLGYADDRSGRGRRGCGGAAHHAAPGRGIAAPITLICLGPLTNLALALALDRPLLQQQVAEIVLMGGEPNAHGNVTPVSEFNFWCDPEAAQMVLHSGIPIRMVGLNVTRRMVLTRAPSTCWRTMTDRCCAGGEICCAITRNSTGCMKGWKAASSMIRWPSRWLSLPISAKPSRCMWKYPAMTTSRAGNRCCDRHGFLGKPANARVYTSARWVDVLQLVNERVFHGALPADELSRGVALG